MRDLHSVGAEPQFQAPGLGPLNTDPAGDPISSVPSDAMEAARGSVFSEPHLVHPDHSDFARLLTTRQAQSTPAMALHCAAAAGVLAGPVAVLSAFVGGNPGITGAFYVVVAGPIVEEIAKQSGLFYLLEKKPWLLIRKWQFPLCAALTAFIFAVIENLLYIHVYATDLPPSSRTSLATFRWTVCVGMHVGCALIASLGLAKVWKETTLQNRPASFASAATYIAIAAAFHGSYNLWALVAGNRLFN